MSYAPTPDDRLTTARRPSPRATATLVAGALALLLSLAELGVLGGGAGIALRCDLRAIPPFAADPITATARAAPDD